jgi:hypothetical protein
MTCRTGIGFRKDAVQDFWAYKTICSSGGCGISASARGPLQQVVEIGAKSLLVLRIHSGGGGFLRFLFPPLSFFTRTQLASHSYPHAAADRLSKYNFEIYLLLPPSHYKCCFRSGQSQIISMAKLIKKV